MSPVTAVEFSGAPTKIPVAVKVTIAMPEVITVEALAKAAVAISEAAVLESLTPFKAASTVIEVTSPVKPASVVSPAIETRPAVIPRPVVAMKPGARADEYSADEPVWAVVAVGRAGVGVIVIVTVRADRSRTIVGRANSHADNHSLCRRRSRGCKHANGQQSEIL